jgi:hypothetical protein
MTDDRIAPTWYSPLTAIRSLGSEAARPGSLAGLHDARRKHLSQFFSPDGVAALLWRPVTPAMDAALARRPGSKVAVLDPTAGSGRLLQFADPDRHVLGAADVHEPSITALAAAAAAAGFEMDIEAFRLEELRARHWGVALVNAPYSIPLEDAWLIPGPTTTFGRFGAHTAAISHAYALQLAVGAADITVAVVPTSYGRSLGADRYFGPLLRAMITLPAGSFRAEGTEVATAVVVLAEGDAPCATAKLGALTDPLPTLHLHCSNTVDKRPRLKSVRFAEGAPVVRMPVTGDLKVRIGHSGRKLALGFGCGLVQAKVMNALLRKRLPPREKGSDRYPKGVQFSGQGMLDLEAWLSQPNPTAALATLTELIEGAGGVPRVDAGLPNYLRKRQRADARARTPFGLFVQQDGCASRAGTAGVLSARAKRSIQCDPLRWGSGLFRAGQEVTFSYDGASYTTTHPTTGENYTVDGDRLRELFDVDASEHELTWSALHPSRAAIHPDAAAAARARLIAVGAERVASWGYQLDDLVELRLAAGGIVGWKMGLGKSRAAIGLCLAGGRHNLICVEPHLVGELLNELREVGLPESEYQVIRTPAQCRALRRINIITYDRLRQEVGKGARRRYADLLRRRIATMVSDEADLLSHPDTGRSRAVRAVSPRRRYAMSGTPTDGYCRELLPLIQWVGGDGTAVQPYGNHRPYMEPTLIRSMLGSARGVDVFRERHVTTTWVTHTFTDNLIRGAKREIPRVAALAELHKWTAPFIKRRVPEEPAVAAHVHTPPYEAVHSVVPWDEEHLGYWLGVADDFGEWYRQARANDGEEPKHLNLTTLLARIGAVLRAGNDPGGASISGRAPYPRLTSKQRFAIERAAFYARDGHKTVVYVQNPSLAEQLAREIRKAGVSAIAFHGNVPISTRERMLRDDFQQGDVSVLVATVGVFRTGINCPHASRGIFAARSWTAKEEQQAMHRLLRPQQTKKTVFEFLELPGSLDTYQRMLLDFKLDAARAAVDHRAPSGDLGDFLHLDTIIESFVANLATHRGVAPHNLRESLKRAA